MEGSLFYKPRNLFIDVVDPKDYIQIDSTFHMYTALKSSVQKPLKMILLYGKPGTGKSMMLQKLHQDLSKFKKVLMIDVPIMDESDFLKVISEKLFGHSPRGEVTLVRFLELTQAVSFDDTPIVILDEAQLYSTNLMEKIRIISDSRAIKFIISLHKTDNEDLIAKEHFQTRIWESIELKNATPDELKIYIQKKLLKSNCFDVANMFSEKSIKKIIKFTKGNYRDTNKLLYTLFSLYMWYEENRPATLNRDIISNKIIELAAIHTGLVRV